MFTHRIAGLPGWQYTNAVFDIGKIDDTTGWWSAFYRKYRIVGINKQLVIDDFISAGNWKRTYIKKAAEQFDFAYRMLERDLVHFAPLPLWNIAA